MKSQRLDRVKPFALLLVAASAAWAGGADYEQAHKLYNFTDFQQSVKVLLAIQSKDAAVYALLGRNYYMEGEFKKASEALEKSFELQPTNAECALWLGRAFGRRAEMASPFTAPGYASRTRQYFEKAVSLNPANLEAQSDLFEYYLEAPGFLGGGMEKAQATAKQVGGISPPEGLAMEAKLAERRKEYSSAEEKLRRALDVAPQQVGRFLDLARFLVRRGRIDEADQVLTRAVKASPDNPRLMYATAEIYVKAHHNLNVAEELLKRYMRATVTPEDPPKSEAAKLLRQVQGG
jgi:cytochrome c-type biogenesis protein CcmH/NrfG